MARERDDLRQQESVRAGRCSVQITYGLDGHYYHWSRFGAELPPHLVEEMIRQVLEGHLVSAKKPAQ